MADDNHTPIPHLLPKDSSQTTGAQPKQKEVAAQDVKTTQTIISPGGKESEPIRQKTESLKPAEDAKDTDIPLEQVSENSGVKQIKQIPKISKEAEKAGVAVAPSARPFPTIYDVKVPIYTDEQIEQNLHKSFWTGARWLAELCKYLLWQSHIKIKKIGNKIIRQTS